MVTAIVVAVTKLCAIAQVTRTSVWSSKCASRRCFDFVGTFLGGAESAAVAADGVAAGQSQAHTIASIRFGFTRFAEANRL
ncbi:MAG: hypothetical protein QM784_39505 [Polyangiaceae bacterium]